MNTDDTDDKDSNCIIYAIHYSCLPDHVFIWASNKLVATPMLKL